MCQELRDDIIFSAIIPEKKYEEIKSDYNLHPNLIIKMLKYFYGSILYCLNMKYRDTWELFPILWHFGKSYIVINVHIPGEKSYAEGILLSAKENEYSAQQTQRTETASSQRLRQHTVSQG